MDFVAELANHAREHHYVVELSGGLLSHAFYMLGKYGCDVECIDRFGVDEESIDFNKIVRDYIPADIQARGEEVETVRLVGDALVEAIKRKLVEESFEVSDAKTADSIAEELADVQEVIDALAAVLTIQKRQRSEESWWRERGCK